MTRSIPARAARRVLWSLLRSRAKTSPSQEDLSAPALFLSPHKDDETLGAGATLLSKVAAGAPVKILFFTDGRNSCQGLMSPRELSALRTEEALAAGSKMGLGKEDLIFLELEDSRLEDFHDQAVQGVLAALEDFRPREVYIPYKGETIEDHLAARRASLEALSRAGRPVRVHEYPVWFWFAWPWVTIPRLALREKPAWIFSGLASGFRLLLDFNRLVPTEGLLERKREILACYKSQTTKLADDPRWTTLGEIGDGAFLECFFRAYEPFHSYDLSPSTEETLDSKNPPLPAEINKEEGVTSAPNSRKGS